MLELRTIAIEMLMRSSVAKAVLFIALHPLFRARRLPIVHKLFSFGNYDDIDFGGLMTSFTLRPPTSSMLSRR